MKAKILAAALALGLAGIGGTMFVSAGEVPVCAPALDKDASTDFEGSPLNHWLVGLYQMPMTMGAELYGAEVLQVIDELSIVVVEADNPVLFFAKAKTDANTRYVEWDSPCEYWISLVPNDTFYNQYQYDMKPATTNMELAWDRTLGTTATKIAMVDTGIRRTHEDFAGGRVLQGFDFRSNDNDPQDQGGLCGYHGSHTSGTAAATINNGKGVAGVSQSQILPVKIFGTGACNTTTSAIVNGLKYAGDQGAHVSSNSWGGGGSSTAINDAITYAHNLGTIHVAAAGNSGSCTNCVGQPWKDMGSISIVVSCSGPNNSWCSFSSQGPQVDVIAPGDDIASVYGGSDTQYSLKDGTSMSCPHVSGVAALIKTLNPSYTFSQVESRIKTNAKDLGFISDRQGAGLLDGDAVF